MSSSLRVWLVACLVLMSGAVPAVALGTKTDPHIEAVRYSGSGNVSVSESGLYLWQSAAHRFTATISATSGIEAELCLVSLPTGAETGEELTCKRTAIPANTTETETISVKGWPTGLNGSQEVGILLRSANGSEVLARESLSLTVIRKDGDLDDDGLTNQREASLATGIHTPDTDDDGLPDGMEVQTYGTSPTGNDTDGDGLVDRAEIHTHGTDPTKADTDGDGLPDARERELGTNPTTADTDGDGIDEGDEVNVHQTDPTEPDTDGDGLGDGTEINDYETNPLKPDTDGDDLSDNIEVNTYGTDPTKIDTDGDGLEDGIEVNESQTDPTEPDTDGDGLTDGQEVQTYGTDPTNPDTDGDGLGDGPEIRRYDTNPDEVDTDNDGQSDYVEVEDRRPGPLDPPITGLVGIAVLLLAGGGVLYRSNHLSESPLRRVHRIMPTDVTTDTDSPDERSADEPTAEAGDVPPEFLSNEERVLGLLDEHGGRIRQSDIVEETGWSKSKVSRVLTGMEEDGRIVKVNVGRGNVVTRPDDLPSGARSPFDDYGR